MTATDSIADPAAVPDGVEGWLTEAQARRLADAAGAVPPGGRIVEIGSFRGKSTIVLARAATPGTEVVAIDPHLGRDRAPQERSENADAGQADFEQFTANLERAGVADRVRHLRALSADALAMLDGPVDLLYVDGAHEYPYARHDVHHWGDRVRPGGTMLVHDSFSSVGVTLALGRTTMIGGGWRYEGRTGSMAAYVREPLSGRARGRDVARQLAELPWFARNVVVKALILARLKPLARVLGHRDGPWPY